MARILLLEPDIRLGRAYAEGLRTRQHQVVVSTTAQDAICQADARQPDVVILELQLTKHSGIEFLYEFRSYPDWQRVPVVVMSQVPPHEFSGSREILRRRLGVRAYHYKPQTNLRTLLHAIDLALAGAVTSVKAH